MKDVNKQKLCKLIDFTKPELDKFRADCNFTDDELAYFNLRARDKSNVQIAMEMNISEAQVSKLAKRVKSKILRVKRSPQNRCRHL